MLGSVRKVFVRISRHEPRSSDGTATIVTDRTATVVTDMITHSYCSPGCCHEFLLDSLLRAWVVTSAIWISTSRRLQKRFSSLKTQCAVTWPGQFPPSLDYGSCLQQLAPRPLSSCLGGGSVGSRACFELCAVGVFLKRKNRNGLSRSCTTINKKKCKCIYFPTLHGRAFKNTSIKDRNETDLECWVLWSEENRRTRKKNIRSKDKNQ